MRKPKGSVLLKLYETAREQFDSDYCKMCEALYIIYLVKTYLVATLPYLTLVPSYLGISNPAETDSGKAL